MTWRAADLPAGLWPGPVILLHRGGPLPEVDAGACDLCLSVTRDAPAPWVAVADADAAQARVLAAVAAQPVAAGILLRVLRLTEALPAEPGLEVESLAFSTLLGGQAFRDWLSRRGALPLPLPLPEVRANPVVVTRSGDAVGLELNDPANHNALSTAMRDALVAALDASLADPTQPTVTLHGGPRVFCSGGALAEFGQAGDLAAAHLLRRAQSVAGRMLALGSRACVQVDGAAIGAGAEIAAAAHRVQAGPRAWFRLPELAMGLIPGAGGCIAIPRRTGRHRAAWLMLTGQRIGAGRALDWGLVDAVAP